MTSTDYITAQNIRYASFACLWLELGLATLLNLKQISYVRSNVKRPTALTPHPAFSKKVYQISSEYSVASGWLRIRIKFYSVLIWTALVFFNMVPFAWSELQFVDSEFDFTPEFLDIELRKTMSFAVLLALFEIYVLELPESFFQTKLKKSYGFYGESLRHWWRYALEESMLETVHQAIVYFFVVCGIQAFDTYTSEHHILTRQILLFFGYIVLMFIYYLLTFKLSYIDQEGFRRLPRGELKSKIDEFCRIVGYNPKDVYIMRVPPWEPANAYSLSFFGTLAHVVFYSSIIEGYYEDECEWEDDIPRGLTVRELQGVFAHEIGHWKYFHSEMFWGFNYMLIGPLVLITALWIGKQPVFFEAFGLLLTESSFPILPGMFIAQDIVLRGVKRLGGVAVNIIGRSFEYSADKHAVENSFGRNLQAGLVSIHVINSRFPAADDFFGLFYESHPTLVQRIENINFLTYGKK